MDPEALTAEQAYELLADKRAKGPAKKPARKGSTRTKSSTKR